MIGRIHPNEERLAIGAPYPDWCIDCRIAEIVQPMLAAQKVAQDSLDASDRTDRARREAGKQAVLARFDSLSEPRTEETGESATGVFGRHRWRVTRTPLERAVPLGDLRWRFAGWAGRDGSVDRSELRATGLTRGGNIVLMQSGPRDDLTFEDRRALADALWAVLRRHGVVQATR